MGYYTTNIKMWPQPKKLQNIPSHMNCIWHLLGHWIDLHKPPQTVGFPHQVTRGFPSPKTFQFVYNWKGWLLIGCFKMGVELNLNSFQLLKNLLLRISQNEFFINLN